MTADHVEFRLARADEAGTIVSLVNEAYQVEAFFVAGDRTSLSEVEALIGRSACYVAAEDDRILGCVEVAAHEARGYFGMLAVWPSSQHRGLGRRLIAFAEETTRRAGCSVMDIKVVSVRPELVTFYSALGYQATGTEPYEHRPLLRPCHFVLMTKAL